MTGRLACDPTPSYILLMDEQQQQLDATRTACQVSAATAYRMARLMIEDGWAAYEVASEQAVAARIWHDQARTAGITLYSSQAGW